MHDLQEYWSTSSSCSDNILLTFLATASSPFIAETVPLSLPSLSRSSSIIFCCFQVGHPPLYVTFSVCPSFHHAPYFRNHTSCDHYFWYMCKMMIYPGVLFIFLKFWFFGFLWGKTAKNKKNYIHHALYLRNSVAYHHDFWCFLHFFKILIFFFWGWRWGGRGGGGGG